MLAGCKVHVGTWKNLLVLWKFQTHLTFISEAWWDFFKKNLEILRTTPNYLKFLKWEA